MIQIYSNILYRTILSVINIYFKIYFNILNVFLNKAFFFNLKMEICVLMIIKKTN